MIGAVDIALLAALVVAGAIVALGAWRVFGLARRLARDPTRQLGSLHPGAVEVMGIVQCTGPTLTAHDGAPAVIVHRVVGYRYRSGGKSRSRPARLTRAEYAPAELRDGREAAALDLDAVILLASRRVWSVDPKIFARDFPLDWAELKKMQGSSSMTQVDVTERSLPDGVRCIVSATASGDGRVIAEGGYRSARERLRLHAAPGRPMLIAAGSEREAVALVRRSAMRQLAVALVSWLAAAIAVVMYWELG